MRVRRLQIEGFRRIEKVDLELGGLSVLIGPNGVGKTSFLDVLLLLGEAMKGGLSRGVARRGGMSRIVSRGSATRLAVRLETEPLPWPQQAIAKSPLVYELELVPQGPGYSIFREQLTQQRDQPQPFKYIQRTANDTRFFDVQANTLERPSWPFDTDELALAQVPRTFLDAERFRDSLASTRSYFPISLDDHSVLRLPQTLQPNVQFPSPGGEDLVSALYRLRGEHSDVYQELMDFVTSAFPGFEKLEFPLVAGGQAALAWHEAGMKALFANELSSGTLRFLHLAAMLLSPELPPILLVDEPELSFHPELLRRFAELVIDASARTQLVVATHAASLVRWLKPEHIVVVQRSDAGAVLTRGDRLDLGHWLETYTLDQLWQMNVIGADA